MIIGINTRLLLKDRLEGIGYFTYALVSRMVKEHKQDKFILFFDRPYDKQFVFADNVVPVVIPLPTRHPILWKIYFDYLLPLYCKKYKIDIFFSPEMYLPKINTIPLICTLHDLNFLHDKDFIGSHSHQRYYLKYTPINANRATKILTVSQYSKQDIILSYNISPSKIDVIYNATNNVVDDITFEQKQDTKRQYADNEDYFYYVGAIHKRKNLTNIFKAFDIFKQKTNSKVKLLIIGSKKWWHGEIEDTYNNMTFKEDVVFLGYLPSEQIAKISASSLALVFPSLFEGFGVPIIEAFACKTAVITSNCTATKEVCAEAGLLVDPYQEEQIAKAMIDIYEDKALRNTLIQKGLDRLKLFSWERISQTLWNIITACQK